MASASASLPKAQGARHAWDHDACNRPPRVRHKPRACCRAGWCGTCPTGWPSTATRGALPRPARGRTRSGERGTIGKLCECGGEHAITCTRSPGLAVSQRSASSITSTDRGNWPGGARSGISCNVIIWWSMYSHMPYSVSRRLPSASLVGTRARTTGQQDSREMPSQDPVAGYHRMHAYCRACKV